MQYMSRASLKWIYLHVSWKNHFSKWYFTYLNPTFSATALCSHDHLLVELLDDPISSKPWCNHHGFPTDPFIPWLATLLILVTQSNHTQSDCMTHHWYKPFTNRLKCLGPESTLYQHNTTSRCIPLTPHVSHAPRIWYDSNPLPWVF